MNQYKVKVMNLGLTKSATILADSFVDFKRKAASQLSVSGWLEVRVYKAEDFEVSSNLTSILLLTIQFNKDVTPALLSSGPGTLVTVESFSFIDFSNSVLIVKVTKSAHSFSGRNVHVVNQGHEHVDNVDIHES